MRAGEADVLSLLDAEGSFGTYAELFPAATEAEWTPWRERCPDLFEGDHWRVPFRSFLIRSGSSTVLVDTCIGPAGEGEFLPEHQGWLLDKLAQAGVAPAEIDTVFLTHVHVDHVGWNSVFDGARFVTHRASVALSAERGRPLPEGTEALDGDAELAPGVVAFETPGHLAGHMSVRVGDDLVLLGDVAVHPAQLARPGLAYAFDDDPARSTSTREAVLAAYGDRILACGHFPGTGFGRLADGVWAPVTPGG